MFLILLQHVRILNSNNELKYYSKIHYSFLLAFVVANYSIRGTAYSAWASFMSYLYHSELKLHHEDIHQQQLCNRLLKLFLTPFLPDYTSKSRSASISKCRAWLILVSVYPTHINDVILPFLSFAFGNHISYKTNSTTITWWLECRRLGQQYLHERLMDNINGEYMILIAGDRILNYLFDSIVDELLENGDDSYGLIDWNAYLTHLTRILTSNKSIDENQHAAINACLLTRIKQLWIDSRLSTSFLLKLLNTFEQTKFPLGIEIVLCDSNIRIETLSIIENDRSRKLILIF